MISYKAVCRKHNFESASYKDERYAKRAASMHKTRVSGKHEVKIIEEYVPASAIEVKSIKPY